MAFKKRSSRRSRRTNVGETTQKDPVVVQQKPEPKVVEAIRAIPETPAPAPVVEKPAPAGGKYGELKFFQEKFIDDLVKVPADLMFYLNNQEKAYKAMRATNLPGDDERAAKLLTRLNELRRVIKGLGYAV